jgi:phage baseplate assembly protein W
MSFDLSLNKGDLRIGFDGDLSKVENTSKLVQDVLKVLHTPIGSNPFYPSLGSPVTTLNIGTVLNQQFLESRVENSITSVIQTIQSIQRKQELTQEVTSAEKILDIVEIVAEQDSQDPRQFNISIKVLTGATDVVLLPSFSLSTTLSGDQ